MSPLVSIIIPVYKVEKYLELCLKSVLEQTYSNLEIILIDDGSPDRCPKICDDYARKDSRFIVVHQENKGLAISRNIGLNICSGDYIFFLDSDDWIHKDCIKKLIEIGENENFDMVIGNYQYFNSSQPAKPIKKFPNYKILTTKEALQNLGNNLGLTFTISCAKLYKRHLWKNIRFPKGKLYEDAYVCHQLYAISQKIAFIDAPLYNYLQRPDSIMGKTINPLHALEPRLFFNQFLKEKYPELQYISLSKLCWDYLFAYSQEYKNKEHLEKFYFYYNDYRKMPKPLSIQKIFLGIFAAVPCLYVLYQRKSPFRLRSK